MVTVKVDLSVVVREQTIAAICRITITIINVLPNYIPLLRPLKKQAKFILMTAMKSSREHITASASSPKEARPSYMTTRVYHMCQITFFFELYQSSTHGPYSSSIRALLIFLVGVTNPFSGSHTSLTTAMNWTFS